MRRRRDGWANAEKHVTDGKTNERTNRRTNKLIGWMDEWMEIWMNGWMNNWMQFIRDGWMNAQELTARQIDRRMDRRTNEVSDEALWRIMRTKRCQTNQPSPGADASNHRMKIKVGRRMNGCDCKWLDDWQNGCGKRSDELLDEQASGMTAGRTLVKRIHRGLSVLCTPWNAGWFSREFDLQVGLFWSGNSWNVVQKNRRGKETNTSGFGQIVLRRAK